MVRMDKVTIELVAIEKPEDVNVIIGMAHFIKTAEDLYEALVNSVPGIKFGLAFSEASSDRLIRTEGTDEGLVKLAAENLERLHSGHSFLIMLKDAYPINVLNRIKDVPEVCNIACATQNAVSVVIAHTAKGDGILGVVDGQGPLGIEGEEDRKRRRELVRKFGYKK
jgi:adenosine/AMP kinase